MVQWYAFALLAASLWLWFHRPRAERCGRWLTSAVDRRTRTRRGAPRRGRRTLAWIAAVALAPIVASYAVYYFFPRGADGQLRNAAADGADSGHRGNAARRLAVPRWTICAGAGCWSRTAAAIAMPPASAGSTPRGRRERCRARSRSASCGSCCGRAARRPLAALLAQHPGLVVVRVTARRRREVPGRRRVALPHRSARQPGAALSGRSRHQGHRQGPDAPPQGVANRLSAPRLPRSRADGKIDAAETRLRDRSVGTSLAALRSNADRTRRIA